MSYISWHQDLFIGLCSYFRPCDDIFVRILAFKFSNKNNFIITRIKSLRGWIILRRTQKQFSREYHVVCNGKHYKTSTPNNRIQSGRPENVSHNEELFCFKLKLVQTVVDILSFFKWNIWIKIYCFNRRLVFDGAVKRPLRASYSSLWKKRLKKTFLLLSSCGSRVSDADGRLDRHWHKVICFSNLNSHFQCPASHLQLVQTLVDIQSFFK